METILLAVAPGAATVRAWTSGRRSTLSRTMMYSAMSIANAMRVIRPAKKVMKDASRAIVTCDERENRKAIKVAPVAAVRSTLASGMDTNDGSDIQNRCTVRPRVEPDSIITLLEADMSCVE